MVPINSVEQETDNSFKIDTKFVRTVWRVDWFNAYLVPK
jgi:hypothetical protein